MNRFTAVLCAILFCAFPAAPRNALADEYSLNYRVHLEPGATAAEVSLELRGEKLPTKLVLHLDPEHHSGVRSEQELELEDDRASWRPRGPVARLDYRFAIPNEKSSGRFDAYITDNWAILRSDKLVPPISATMPKGLESRASLEFDLPPDWSAVAPYEKLQQSGDAVRYRVIDPGRSLPRPKGWLILGRLAVRTDEVAGVKSLVAAPRGQGGKLQDLLAFLNWNMPALTQVFPDFPPRVLVVTAGQPMWRGGLSGPRSLFMHSDRPLVSGNRTSSLLHELVHVATGITGDHESDWIVEGLAEYYASNLLYRSGGISEARYREALVKLEVWGRDADSLLVKRASGAVTARAVGVMVQLDHQIRTASGGSASLDDVARALARDRGRVSLASFTGLAAAAAGEDIAILKRETLSRPAPAPRRGE